MLPWKSGQGAGPPGPNGDKGEKGQKGERDPLYVRIAFPKGTTNYEHLVLGSTTKVSVVLNRFKFALSFYPYRRR